MINKNTGLGCGEGKPSPISVRKEMIKTVVIDLDGVVADVDAAISELLISRGLEDYDYSTWLSPDTDSTDAIEIYNNPLFWKNIKPFEDAWHQINKWFSDAVDVYIISDRSNEQSRSLIEPWLDGWKISSMVPIQAIYHSKSEVIEELDPDIVVDDNPIVVSNLLEKGINVFLKKTWYNRSSWSDLPTIDTLYDIKI